VKSGTLAQDFGSDFSGWYGRTADLLRTDEGETRIQVIWDSFSLKNLPLAIIAKCEQEGIDWTGALLRLDEIERAEPRDTWDEVQDAVEQIEGALGGVLPCRWRAMPNECRRGHGRREAIPLSLLAPVCRSRGLVPKISLYFSAILIYMKI